MEIPILLGALPHYATPVFSRQGEYRSTRGPFQHNVVQAYKKQDTSSYGHHPVTQPPRGRVLLPLVFVDGHEVHTASDPATSFSCVRDDSWKTRFRAVEVVFYTGKVIAVALLARGLPLSNYEVRFAINRRRTSAVYIPTV